jgi:hypothetical protein
MGARQISRLGAYLIIERFPLHRPLGLCQKKGE